LQVLFDYKIHFEIVALALFIMSGYIINAFYDLEKDLINNPRKAIIDRLISKEFSFYVYFVFNGIGAFLSLFVSWPVFFANLFFSFALWFYSHKMRKKPILGELAAAILTVLPFVSLSIYYGITNNTILIYFFFLGLMIYTREVIKKLIAIKGDLILGDKSIPIVFGVKRTQLLLATLYIITLGLCLPIYNMVRSPIVHVYLLLVIINIATNFYFLANDSKRNYLKMNNLYKIVLILAIFCIPFLFA